jgi:hypothetical protein
VALIYTQNGGQEVFYLYKILWNVKNAGIGSFFTAMSELEEVFASEDPTDATMYRSQ